MNQLEMQFHADMVNIYKTAKKECGYTATRFLQLISSKGGVWAAKQLIMKQTDGFSALAEFGRLDLSVEACVLKPQYISLFTEAEREVCRARLKDLGFQIEQNYL